MTDNPQDKFDEIVERVAKEETISNEDAKFLVAVIANLDKNARVSYEMAEVCIGASQDILVKTALTVMNRCGRTDEKKRKEVIKVCEQAFSNLVNIVRASGVAAMQEQEGDTDAE